MVKMVAVPTRVPRGGVSAQPLNFDPLAQGLSRVGSAVQEVADRQQRAMDHAAGILFDQGRREAIAAALDEAKAAAGPAGKGYGEAAMKLYQERAAKLLPSLPEGISQEARQRFEVEIESGAGAVQGAAREYVLGAEKAYQVQAFETVRADAQRAILADPAAYGAALSNLEATVDRLTGSAFSPEQALDVKRKLRAEAAGLAVESLVQRGDEDIAETALDPKRGRIARDLDADGQIQAKRRIEAARERRRIERDRAENEAEKALKRRQEEAEKEYFDKLTTGALTEADMAQAKKDLSPSAYRTLLDVHRRGDGQDRPDVVKSITDKIYGQGQDAKADIQAAHRDGKLSNDTAAKLYKENDAKSGAGDDKVPVTFRAQIDYVRNSLRTSDFNFDPNQAQNQAEAVRAITLYAQEPGRTVEQVQKYADQLVGTYTGQPPKKAPAPGVLANPPPVTGDGFTRPAPLNAKDLGIAPKAPAPAPAAPAAKPATPTPATPAAPAAPQVKPRADLPPAPAAYAKQPAQRTPEERQQVTRWIQLYMIRKHGGDKAKIMADPAFQRIMRENGAMR
jgi:hypothetical protein